MKPGTIALTLALFGTAAVAATPVLQQEAAMSLVKPSPQHTLLQKMAGTWDAKFEMAGQTTDGVYTRKLAMNNLWLLSEYKGSMMGTPFTGHEILGWDEAKGKYVSAWIDSTSTSMSLMEGNWNAGSRTMTLSGEGLDPMSGQATTMVYVATMPDDDTMVFQMHMGAASTPPMMKITYTRR